MTTTRYVIECFRDDPEGGFTTSRKLANKWYVHLVDDFHAEGCVKFIENWSFQDEASAIQFVGQCVAHHEEEGVTVGWEWWTDWSATVHYYVQIVSREQTSLGGDHERTPATIAEDEVDTLEEAQAFVVQHVGPNMEAFIFECSAGGVRQMVSTWSPPRRVAGSKCGSKPHTL